MANNDYRELKKFKAMIAISSSGEKLFVKFSDSDAQEIHDEIGSFYECVSESDYGPIQDLKSAIVVCNCKPLLRDDEIWFAIESIDEAATEAIKGSFSF
jgi:hypothetical protein